LLLLLRTIRITLIAQRGNVACKSVTEKVGQVDALGFAMNDSGVDVAEVEVDMTRRCPKDLVVVIPHQMLMINRLDWIE
jgi:hypothetical protein